MKRFLSTAVLAFGASSAAYAACTSPAGDAGHMFYNTTVNTMQFCDGSAWVNMARRSDSAIGTSCTNPTGAEGSMYYNTTQNTVQFCNGDNWVNMGTQKFPSATGTSCTTPTGAEGSIFYNTTYNRMQFCNGDDWVNATFRPEAFDGEELMRVIASDPKPSDRYGYSVSVSGNYAVAGAYTESSAGHLAGAAYVFDATTGNQLHKLIATDAEAEDYFGQAVSISENLVIIGSTLEDTAAPTAGAAYIFDAATGIQLKKLMASDAQSADMLGSSVAISSNHAVVGSSFHSAGGAQAGAVYIFDTTTGSQLHKLMPSDIQSFDNFGHSVGISGNYAIAGAPNEDDGGLDAGAAYIFDVTTGTQVHKLVATDAQADDRFGVSVAIFGNRAIVGANRADSGATDTGAAYIFDVTTGNQLHKLTVTGAKANDRLGMSVAISSKHAIVGANGEDNSGGVDAGAAYAFDVNTGDQLHKMTAAEPSAGDYFGTSVSISGNTAVIGAYYEDTGAGNAGAAYIFH